MKTPEAAKNIEELLKQIRQATKGGNYIFRGEAKKHLKISSTLYRAYQKEIRAKYFDIDLVEEKVVSEAKKHTHEKDSNIILEQLQHYGGKTNWIDFSADYLVALFFACYGDYEKDGRLILLNKKGVKIHAPTDPQNRVIAQKSIFVRPPKGFIKPDGLVIVPRELKENVLKYLNKYHNIRTATVYNDIHGYIAQKPIHKSVYTHVYRGATYYNKGKFLKAIDEYDKAIKLDPNLAMAYTNRGNAYSREGEYNLALADHNKAIKLNRKDAKSYANRGDVYRRKAEHDLAIADFNKALELNPNLAMVYTNRGNAYIKKDEYKLAIADHNKAIEINPNDAVAYIFRSMVYTQKGEYDLVIEDCDKAIELNPNESTAYLNRGYAYEKKGAHDLAIADYNKAIELNPIGITAYINRGTIYGRQGDHSRAIDDFNKVIELDPKHVGAYTNRGVAYENMGNYDRAINEFSKAIKLDPNYGEAYINRGISYNKDGHHDRAIGDFSKAIELDPNHIRAYINRGIAKQALPDIKGAKEDFKNVLRLVEQQGNKPLAALVRKKIDELPADSDS